MNSKYQLHSNNNSNYTEILHSVSEKYLDIITKQLLFFSLTTKEVIGANILSTIVWFSLYLYIDLSFKFNPFNQEFQGFIIFMSLILIFMLNIGILSELIKFINHNNILNSINLYINNDDFNNRKNLKISEIKDLFIELGLALIPFVGFSLVKKRREKKINSIEKIFSKLKIEELQEINEYFDYLNNKEKIIGQENSCNQEQCDGLPIPKFKHIFIGEYNTTTLEIWKAFLPLHNYFKDETSFYDELLDFIKDPNRTTDQLQMLKNMAIRLSKFQKNYPNINLPLFKRQKDLLLEANLCLYDEQCSKIIAEQIVHEIHTKLIKQKTNAHVQV